MNRDNIIAILGILKTAYPSFYANMTKAEGEATIALWQEMFNDTSPAVVTLAVKSLISHLKFPPTIADVKEEIANRTHKENAIDYWNEAYNMICNGSYMTQEEFEQCSEVCQRYFGSVARLREKSRTENLNLEVEQSNFNKVAESLITRKKQDLMLPANVKKEIDKLAEHMSIKMIGE